MFPRFIPAISSTAILGDNNVRLIQTYLLRIAHRPIRIFRGLQSQEFMTIRWKPQSRHSTKNLPALPPGIIGPEVWNNIVRVYTNLVKK